MKRNNILIGALVMASSLGVAAPDTQPKPKRKSGKPSYTPHPAMPEGGWPETRQQRRARERAQS